MKNWLILLKTITILTITNSNVLYAAPGECKVISAEQGKFYVLKGKILEHIHLTLPDLLAVTPVIANDLWQVQGSIATPHVWIQPKSNADVGKFGTVTLITQNKKTYNFKLIKVDKNHDLCVTVKDKDGSFVSAQNLKKLYEASDSTMVNSSLKKELDEEKRSSRMRAIEAIRRYQGTIYSSYTWSSYGSNPIAKDTVASVFDDGRFTYVRLNDDKFGLPVVFGLLNGKEQLVEANYDDRNKTYKITGLYPQLKIQMKKGGVKIKRSDLK